MFITVPDTGKCLVINSSLTFMLKWVSCLEERANPPSVLYYHATGMQPTVHFPGDIPWHEHCGRNSQEIRSLSVRTHAAHSWASCFFLLRPKPEWEAEDRGGRKSTEGVLSLLPGTLTAGYNWWSRVMGSHWEVVSPRKQEAAMGVGLGGFHPLEAMVSSSEQWQVGVRGKVLVRCHFPSVH